MNQRGAVSLILVLAAAGFLAAVLSMEIRYYFDQKARLGLLPVSTPVFPPIPALSLNSESTPMGAPASTPVATPVPVITPTPKPVLTPFPTSATESPSVPAVPPPSPSAIPAPAAATPAVITRSITAKSLVGLNCYGIFTNPDNKQSLKINIGQASGVIINPAGYILTARHIIDPKWTSWAYGESGEMKFLNDNTEFSYCEVAPSTRDELPTPEQIKKVNPALEIPKPYPYGASLYFKPSRGQLSDLEYRHLDFAILQIDRPVENCQIYTDLCDLPASYPYNPVLYSDIPQTGDELINFGFPSEAGSPNLELKGAVGELKKYYGGDNYFKNTPFGFEWSAIDVIPGRSGSPVFWNGYAVGVQYATAKDNVTVDYAVGTPAIYQILKDNNLGQLLLTE